MILWVRNSGNIWLACLWPMWHQLWDEPAPKVTSLPTQAGSLGALWPFSAHDVSSPGLFHMTWAFHHILVSESPSCSPFSWWLFSNREIFKTEHSKRLRRKHEDSYGLFMGVMQQSHLQWMSFSDSPDSRRESYTKVQSRCSVVLWRGGLSFKTNYSCTLYPWENP